MRRFYPDYGNQGLRTVSLKMADIDATCERAFDQDADIRFHIKHEVPIFNRPFSQIAEEYTYAFRSAPMPDRLQTLKVRRIRRRP